ncbi:MAG TPA: PrsW family glutamic-type intramembrane protease [bacterium]|jgi:RsiW-degrading membrane proteinase PrsW (M82 family)
MFLVVLALAPVVFWLWYFQMRDRLHPEPRALVVRVFVFGGVVAIPAAFIELGVLAGAGLTLHRGSAADALAAAFIIGVVEESVKFAAVMFGVYRNVEFNEVIDGIIYAVAASLGFAAVENLFYVLQGGVSVGLLRAFLSIPGHAFFGAIMGFYMGAAKFSGPRERQMLLAGLVLAILAHTAYDGVLFVGDWIGLAVVPIVLFLWRRSVLGARRASLLDDERVKAQAPPDQRA